MLNKDYAFMEIDKNYYQELVKEADFYKQALLEIHYLKQEIEFLIQENHILEQKLQDLETEYNLHL